MGIHARDPGNGFLDRFLMRFDVAPKIHVHGRHALVVVGTLELHTAAGWAWEMGHDSDEGNQPEEQKGSIKT